jgi:hypothetical protein
MESVGNGTGGMGTALGRIGWESGARTKYFILIIWIGWERSANGLGIGIGIGTWVGLGMA